MFFSSYFIFDFPFPFAGLLLHNTRMQLGKHFISEGVQGPAVEFFNPKMRRELEKKDEETKRVSGKGGSPGTDDWTYLNSFSRVPVSIKQKSFILSRNRSIFHYLYGVFVWWTTMRNSLTNECMAFLCWFWLMNLITNEM